MPILTTFMVDSPNYCTHQSKETGFWLKSKIKREETDNEKKISQENMPGTCFNSDAARGIDDTGTGSEWRAKRRRTTRGELECARELTRLRFGIRDQKFRFRDSVHAGRDFDRFNVSYAAGTENSRSGNLGAYDREQLPIYV